jgi:hypothetical protein
MFPHSCVTSAFVQCRALGAAIFGPEDYKVEIRAIQNRNILDYLANGTVDVVPTRPGFSMEDDIYMVRAR